MPVVQSQSIETSHSLMLSFSSRNINVLGAEAWSVQAVISGVATGTLIIEYGNDGTNWDLYDSVSVTAAVCKMFFSAAYRVPYKFIRLRWSETAGTSTGSLDVTAIVIGTYNE
jgi:hypothetical protein